MSTIIPTSSHTDIITTSPYRPLSTSNSTTEASTSTENQTETSVTSQQPPAEYVTSQSLTSESVITKEETSFEQLTTESPKSSSPIFGTTSDNITDTKTFSSFKTIFSSKIPEITDAQTEMKVVSTSKPGEANITITEEIFSPNFTTDVSKDLKTTLSVLITENESVSTLGTTYVHSSVSDRDEVSSTIITTTVILPPEVMENQVSVRIKPAWYDDIKSKQFKNDIKYSKHAKITWD